jgi:hypothetical protein
VVGGEVRGEIGGERHGEEVMSAEAGPIRILAVEAALRENAGRVFGPPGAAAMLGMSCHGLRWSRRSGH